MGRVLAVSRGGYYDWRRRPPSARAQDNVTLDAAITEVFTAQKGRAGSPCVTLGVQANGISAGRHRVAGRMKKLRLRAKAAKKFKATMIPIALALRGRGHTPITPCRWRIIY